MCAGWLHATSRFAASEEHEGYAGDKSDAGSSGDEQDACVRNAARGILPMLSSVVVPKPKAFSLDELKARGGTPIERAAAGGVETSVTENDDWL